jgi:hypothetical protein
MDALGSRSEFLTETDPTRFFGLHTRLQFKSARKLDMACSKLLRRCGLSGRMIPDAIRQVKALGIKSVVMLTGDNQPSFVVVANALRLPGNAEAR